MINQKLVEIINEEVEFQNNQNQKLGEKYRLQAEYHTKLVEKLAEESSQISPLRITNP